MTITVELTEEQARAPQVPAGSPS